MVSLTDRPELRQTTPVGSDGEATSSGQKWSAEYHLLASLPGTIGSGIVVSAKDAYEHKARTILEGASAVALGAGFSLLSKNPKPAVAAVTTMLGRAFIGVAAADLGYRFAEPMHDVWVNTSNLEADKVKLGNNLGEAVFNYGLAIGEGGLGAQLGEKFLAPTRFGSFLQGFTETTVDGKLLNDPIDKQLLPGISKLAAAGDRLPTAGDTLPSATPTAPAFTGNVKLRTLSDGSQVAFDGKNVFVSTKDGAHMWFRQKQSFLGLNNQLDLKRVVRLSTDEAQPLQFYNSADVFLKKGRFGTDLLSNATPEASPQGQTYSFSDGMKVFADANERVFEVGTPGARVYSPRRGNWHYNPIANLEDELPSPVVPKATTIGTVSVPKPTEINLVKFTDTSRPYEKGFEAALGQMMIERGGDIGTSVVERYLLNKEA